MDTSNLEVIEYNPNKKSNSHRNDVRYAVFDKINNKIVDDAQGYGYRSKDGAMSAYVYKNREPVTQEVKDFYNDIKTWLKPYKSELIKDFEYAWFISIKEGIKFDRDDEEEFLKDYFTRHNIECPFKIKYVLKELIWEMR